METLRIEKVERGTPLARELYRFVEGCSWLEVKEHTLAALREWEFTDWETPFAAVADGHVVAMATIMKTDYYPLPEVFPWISTVFVSEGYRGRRISGRLIEHANRYAGELGFTRTYIPTEIVGLYEKYGYRYLRDIVNYGGGVDRLYAKDIV